MPPIGGHERVLETAGALHSAIFQASELGGEALQARGYEALDEVKTAAYAGHVVGPGAHRGVKHGEQGLVQKGDEKVQHLGRNRLDVFRPSRHLETESVSTAEYCSPAMASPGQWMRAGP